MNDEGDGANLTEVFVSRVLDTLSDPCAGRQIDMAPTDCFRLHRVHWRETRLSEDRTRLICVFRAPDAESVRIALRMSGIPFDAVWTDCK